jgi:hypothetical protein
MLGTYQDCSQIWEIVSGRHNRRMDDMSLELSKVDLYLTQEQELAQPDCGD